MVFECVPVRHEASCSVNPVHIFRNAECDDPSVAAVALSALGPCTQSLRRSASRSRLTCHDPYVTVQVLAPHAPLELSAFDGVVQLS
jgi:hypothetical protein